MAIIFKNNNSLKNTYIIFNKQADKTSINKKIGNKVIVYNEDKTVSQITINGINDEIRKINNFSVMTNDDVKTLSLEEYNLDIRHHFIVGVVTEREQHPKSDKLFVLKVNIGNEELQIVTNSKNSTINQKVVVATVGSITPAGLEIVQSKVMKVDSFGMLCGGETLNLPSTNGIYIPDDYNIGDPFVI